MSVVRVRFYAAFRDIVGGKQAEVEVAEGGTVGDLLTAIITRWPELHEHLLNEDGSFSKRANLFVDGRALRFLPDGLSTPLDPEQEIDCFQAVAGG